MKKINRVFITALTIAILSSCMSEEACPEKDNIYSFQIQIPSLTGSGNNESNDVVNTLDAYIFNNKGKSIRHFKRIEMNQEGMIRLALDATQEIGSIYFLANYPNIPDNEVATEADLINRSTSQTTESPDKYFMTSSFKSATTGSIREELSFTRSASRIDLSTGDNPLLEIDSITISNVADRSYLFPHSEHSTPENTRFTTYTRRFASSPARRTGETLKGLFYVYENGMETANVSVYGRYNGVNSRIDLDIPNIYRNYLYTITLKPVGQIIEGSIKTEGWQEGGEITAGNVHTKTII